MKTSSLSSLSAIGLAVCFCGLSAAQAQPPVSDDAARAIQGRREAQRRLMLARMPIPEAARLHGGDYVVEQTVFEELVARNLVSLAADSELVVVGRVAGGVSFLSPDERMISTTYQVQVVEAPKDAFVNFGSATGQVISVIMPGGKITVGDGITAEMRYRNRKPLAVGDTCAFFLQRVEKAWPASQMSDRTRSAYVPRLGSQGVFRLTADGVKPEGSSVSPLFIAFATTPNTEFVGRVRAAAK
jgi:hypothetical protein